MKKVIFSLLMAVCALSLSAKTTINPNVVPSTTNGSDSSQVWNIWKYNFNVKGWAPNSNHQTEVNLNVNVKGDYRFDITLPANGSDEIAFDTLVIDNEMQLVPSLEVNHHHNVRQFPYDEGKASWKADYSFYLPNLYGFGGANVPVYVYDAVDTMHFVYNITKEGNQVIGRPDRYYSDYLTKKYGARDAWYLLCSKVTPSRDESGDSYFLFKKGAYIQLGNEKMVFYKDCKLMNHDGSFKQIYEELHKTDTVDILPCTSEKQYMFLHAGSVIAIGCSEAELKENMLMTIYYEGDELNGVLTDLKQETVTRERGLYNILSDVNKIAKVIDENQPRIDLQFSGLGTGYNEGKKDGQEIQTPGEYKAMQDTAKNAVLVVDKMYEILMGGLNNVVIDKDKNGNYTCSNFVLTDISEENYIYSEKCDFYTPKNFTATAGSYTRALTKNYNSCCVPFKFNANNVVDKDGNPANGVKIYTVSSCDGTTVNLEEVSGDVTESTPCLIFCEDNDDTLKVVFNETPIVYSIDEAQNGDLGATYVRTGKFGTSGTYMLTTDGLNFGDAAATVYPFRAVLKYTVAGAPARMAIRIIGKGNPTALDEVEVNADGSIFSLDGRKLNAVPAAGLYIQGGKVKFAK